MTARMVSRVVLSQERATAHVRQTREDRRATPRAFRWMRCGGGMNMSAREVSTTSRDQDDHKSTDASRTANSRSCRSAGPGRESEGGDLDLKPKLRAPITNLEEETSTL